MPVFSDKLVKTSTFFSVIIAARNEAETIPKLLEDLAMQSYLNFEVIVVNDHSTDNTVQNVCKLIDKWKIDAKIIDLTEESFGKKVAIKTGISLSKGNYIVTTDADCRVGKNWLASFASFIAKERPKLISAPVTLDFSKSFFEKIQTIEFISLVGSGAVFMHSKKPNMCNGANICYTKQVFEEVKGFEGNEHIASGDDEFLMHKIAKLYPEKVRFLKSKEAIVRTQAKESVKEFFHQRKRWASKWSHYEMDSALWVAIIVFCFHLSFCLLPFFYLANCITLPFLVSIFLFKMIAEFILLSSLLVFTSQQNKIWLIPFVSFLHPYYVVLFGIGANFGSYYWKGRTH